MPGPNGTAEETTTVRASGAVTVSGLPPTVSADTSGLAGPRVVQRLEGEDARRPT